MKVFIVKAEKKQPYNTLCEKLPPRPPHTHTCVKTQLVYHTRVQVLLPHPPRPDYYHSMYPLNRSWLTKWSRPKDPQHLNIMARAKAFQEQMRTKVIEILSGLPIKFSESRDLQRESLPTKLPQERSDHISKRSWQHPINWRSHLPQWRSVFVTPPEERRWAKLGCIARAPRQKPLLSENTKAYLVLPENILMSPKTFWKILYGLRRPKLNFLEGGGRGRSHSFIKVGV